LILNEYSGVITNVRSAKSKNGTPMALITLEAKNRKGVAKSINVIQMNPKLKLKVGYVVSIRSYDEPGPSKNGQITHFVDEIDVLGVNPRVSGESPAEKPRSGGGGYNSGYRSQESAQASVEDDFDIGEDGDDGGDTLPF